MGGGFDDCWHCGTGPRTEIEKRKATAEIERLTAELDHYKIIAMPGALLALATVEAERDRLRVVAIAVRTWRHHPDRGLARHCSEEGAAIMQAIDAYDAQQARTGQEEK